MLAEFSAYLCRILINDMKSSKLYNQPCSVGRLIRLCKGCGSDLGWAILFDITNKGKSQKVSVGDWCTSKSSRYVITAVLLKNLESGKTKFYSEDDAMIIRTPLPLLTAISAVKVNIKEGSLKALIPDLVRGLKQCNDRYGDNLPLLDPIKDLKVDETEFTPLQKRLKSLQAMSRNHKNLKETRTHVTAENVQQPSLTVAAESAKERVEMYSDSLEELRASMKDSHLSLFQGELKSRSRVLRRLGHIDENDIVQLKGRAACQIDTSDELMAAELMFDGTFSKLDFHSVAALASCLIPMEKSNETIKLKAVLTKSLNALQDAAKRIADLSKECGLDIDTEEYVQSFGPDLMDIIYSWSKGADFGAITQQTDLFEGSIVRAMRRLDELLQQLSAAADAVGEKLLYEKFQKASESIRRGIVFSNSLYIAEE